MTEYISREAAIKAIRKQFENPYRDMEYGMGTVDECEDILNALPVIEGAECATSKGDEGIRTELKPCPFCGEKNIYETYSQEYSLGTKCPKIFCNNCKAIFTVEDDSPYMTCEEDYVYRKNKTREAWNRRVDNASYSKA